MTSIPDHPALSTRHAIQHRQETRARMFSPVTEFGDTRPGFLSRLAWAGARLLIVAAGFGILAAWIVMIGAML